MAIRDENYDKIIVDVMKDVRKEKYEEDEMVETQKRIDCERVSPRERILREIHELEKIHH